MMLFGNISRRHVLKSTLAWAGAAIWTGRGQRAFGFANANERPRIGAVGTGSRWYVKATGIAAHQGTAPRFVSFGDYVAVCDVDSIRRERAGDLVKHRRLPDIVADYRTIIDRSDIDIVHISTPDHWHAKIAIEAMLSGKDVYCEKPMTLTIEEGQQMCEVCRKTGRIVQIGTQQRSDLGFLKAVALIRDGRIGDLKKATCGLGAAPPSPRIPQTDVPDQLDWNQWLGPAPQVPFRYQASDNGETKSWSRCHYEFRWWYEYSGGKLTDWGAHHIDIATWAMGKTETGPISINPVMYRHPIPFKDGYPTEDSQYNAATEFLIQAKFADGMEIEIRHDGDNGILFEGTEGRVFVNRSRLTGKAVDELPSKPLPDGALEAVYKNGPLVNHFQNFFESVVARKEPISDVFSHHRSLTTCHLAGIAVRLGRELHWDPKTETIIGDVEAQRFIAREKRKGFEIEF